MLASGEEYSFQRNIGQIISDSNWYILLYRIMISVSKCCRMFLNMSMAIIGYLSRSTFEEWGLGPSQMQPLLTIRSQDPFLLLGTSSISWSQTLGETKELWPWLVWCGSCPLLFCQLRTCHKLNSDTGDFLVMQSWWLSWPRDATTWEPVSNCYFPFFSFSEHSSCSVQVRCKKRWYGMNIGAFGASKALTVNSLFLTVFVTLSANKVVSVQVKVS